MGGGPSIPGPWHIYPLMSTSTPQSHHLGLFMSLFGAHPAPVCGDVLAFYMDFETSGLDVLVAEVLEIGVTEDFFRCVGTRLRT